MSRLNSFAGVFRGARRPFATAALLLVLLATLGTLQYRWLGEVSEAERNRMRAGLRARATDLAREFDDELTRLYAAIHAAGDQVDADPSAAIADAYSRWQRSTMRPDLVRALYFVESSDLTTRPRRFDFTRHMLETTDWPPDVRAMLSHAHEGAPAIPGLPAPMFVMDAINGRVPALVIVVPRVTRSTTAGRTMIVADRATLARAIIVVLDRDRVVHELLEPLVAKYFGGPSVSEYFVTVAQREEPSAEVFSTSPSPVDAASADVTAGLFDLRPEALGRLAQDRLGIVTRPGTTERVAVTFVRRGSLGDTKRIVSRDAGEPGAWQLRVRHRSGSLETIVAASRRRNLAIGLGVLAVLGASLVLIIASAIRQQRLARQQLEFVAAVSHELRTPLAVICSAGENLADGVVTEAPQVQRYGALIETEGRRLSAMVERVLDFAGIAAGTLVRTDGQVDVAGVLRDAVRSVDADARERDVAVALHIGERLPSVAGDADALRSAFQNIVGNAVKYSRAGETIDVGADAVDSQVRISVVDHGLGVDGEDLPHIFKPFYRGRRAVDAQVRGSGVGLSVVRNVVDAHRGRIDLHSRPGEGTVVTVWLNAASQKAEVRSQGDAPSSAG